MTDSAPKWLRLAQIANFGHFAGFSKLVPQNQSQGVTQNDQFHPIQNWWKLYHQSISFCRNLKNFDSMGRGTSAIFLSFSTFSNHFTLKQLKMTHNGKICQNSGLAIGSKVANFGHFAGFSIFPPKIRLRLTWNGQFHLIHNFSHLFTTKVSHFAEISKFLFLGRYIGRFFGVFKHFSNDFTRSGSKWVHNGQFCHQGGLDELEMGNFG